MSMNVSGKVNFLDEVKWLNQGVKNFEFEDVISR